MQSVNQSLFRYFTLSRSVFPFPVQNFSCQPVPLFFFPSTKMRYSELLRISFFIEAQLNPHNILNDPTLFLDWNFWKTKIRLLIVV
jgi:hypothetical protein